jgi:hypothetical protein
VQEDKTYELSFKYGSTPTTTVVVPTERNDEHESFAQLAAKLVQVPKSELDEKLKS